MSLALILVLGEGLPLAASPDIPRRKVSLEWEKVEGVPAYELEVRRFINAKGLKDPVFFKVGNSSWNARLVPGRYQLRVRAFDNRGVPGEWGDPTSFVVQLPPPTLLKPAAQTVFRAEDEAIEKVLFQWESVMGATSYKVRVLNEKGDVIAEDTTTGLTMELKLPVASTLRWQVIPLLNDDPGDGGQPRQEFRIVGGILKNPDIDETHPNLVSEIRWQPVQFAQKYEFILERSDKTGWKKIAAGSSVSSFIRLKKPLASGEYRMRVRALAENRQPSGFMERGFSVDYDDRGPAAIEQAKTEQSVESPKRLYAMAQYIVALVTYSGLSADNGFKRTSYDVVGGTGRLGIGYWIKDSSYGLLGSAELSGIQVGSQSYQYSAAQIDVGYKARLGSWGQMRAWTGIQYRELPETLPVSDGVYTMSKIANLGPHLSFSYLKGFTPKFGINLNTNLFYSAAALKTPTGAPNRPRLSYMFGVLGSLKLGDNLVGFAGYAYKKESAAYAGTSDQADSLGGGDNQVDITGHYMNLMLQWGI